MANLFRLVACLFLCVSLNSFGAIYKISFSGEVSEIFEYLGTISTETKGNYNFHSGRYFNGQSFNGFFIVDDSTPAGCCELENPNKDIYSSVVSRLLNIGGYIYSDFDYISTSQVWNSSGNIDLFHLTGNTYVTPFVMDPNADLSSISLNLYDHDQSVFSSTSFSDAISILNNNTLAEFEYRGLTLMHFSSGPDINNQYLRVDGYINTISISEVPLPAGIYLFLSGLVGLGAVRLRKK